MSPTFVDSGGWYSISVPSEITHPEAIRWLQTNATPLLTTDYVIHETLTLLRSRGHGAAAILLGEWFFESGGRHHPFP